MTTATRLNKVTYGGLLMGVGSSYYLHDAMLTTRSYPSLGLEFTVVFRAASESALLTLETNLLNAVRTPNSALLVVRNGSNFINTTHSGNTGMNSRASAEELPSHRSNRSRAYRVSIELMLPADETGKSGRRDSTWTITTDASGISTLLVRAEYTASGGSSAYTMATTNFPTYVGTIQTLVGGTWDASDEAEYTLDDEVKVCTAAISRRELIFAQSGSGTDDANVTGIQYRVSVRRATVPSLAGSGARALTTSSVIFSAPVRSGQTTDLDSYVTDTIKPYLESIVKDSTDAEGTPVEATWEYTLDPVNNVVSGLIEFNHASTTLIFASLRINYAEFHGKTLVPVASGPFVRDLWKAPQRSTMTIIYREVRTGVGTGDMGRPFDEAIRNAERRGFVRLRDPVWASGSDQIESETGNARLEYTTLDAAAVLDYAELRTKPNPTAYLAGSQLPANSPGRRE